MQKLSITEARHEFMKLPERAANDQVLAITRRNKEVMAVMSWELYEGLLETLEVMADQDVMAQLKRAREDIASGRTLSLSDAQKRLGH